MLAAIAVIFLVCPKIVGSFSSLAVFSPFLVKNVALCCLVKLSEQFQASRSKEREKVGGRAAGEKKEKEAWNHAFAWRQKWTSLKTL